MVLGQHAFIISITIYAFIISCIQGCSVYLSNADFELGTYRIQTSGTYCLTEHIIFNPLPGDLQNPNELGAWYPNFFDTQYGFMEFDDSNPLLGNLTYAPKLGAFSLGFFLRYIN